MRILIIITLLFLATPGIAQLRNEQIHDLKMGKIKRDTSFVYSLPYELGKKPLFIQGAHGNMSHKNELSFDFKMKVGSKICAARAGRVIEIKEDSQEGGLNKKYYNSGNHIIIEHADGSRAMYWHLDYNGAFIKEGQMVRQGQTIGLSGNTGYSAFPHLHFQVIDKNYNEVLPRFYTKKGVRYLRPARKYKGISPE